MPLLKCSASKARPKNGIEYITEEGCDHVGKKFIRGRRLRKAI